MRLSHVLLVAAAYAVATLDATAAASDAQAAVEQALDLYVAGARESVGHGQRFLREHKEVTEENAVVDEDKEERVFETASILYKIKMASSIDDIGPILKDVRDVKVIKNLFRSVEPHMKKVLPEFRKDMAYDQFDLLLKESKLSDDVKVVLMTIFSKYWAATH
ncbi:unnamed protein product [Phytophthora fragariaefolia]|uniref:RxLR effector protein n=1 Tax=Phytophthora fragariaefolia TaxID=1490495 RepID=A0A9W6XH66_9STRA|nr:unnamed protein product [Phytophthora fragariaefolia]